MPLQANTMPRHGTHENKQNGLWANSGQAGRDMPPQNPENAPKTPFLHLQ